jgi:hypothetical protein
VQHLTAEAININKEIDAHFSNNINLKFFGPHLFFTCLSFVRHITAKVSFHSLPNLDNSVPGAGDHEVLGRLAHGDVADPVVVSRGGLLGPRTGHVSVRTNHSFLQRAPGDVFGNLFLHHISAVNQTRSEMR